jgi:hypothetical protein
MTVEQDPGGPASFATVMMSRSFRSLLPVSAFHLSDTKAFGSVDADALYC